MNRFSPLRCIPFHLDKQQRWTEPLLTDAGYYVVIWWKDYALGDMIINAGERLEDHHFEQRLLHNILPALRAYSRNKDLEVKTLSGAIETCNSITAVAGSIPEVADVSVVICTRDRAANLEICLRSLINLRCKPAEIIVVDNATKDDSTRKVANGFSEVKYVREDRPGLDIARNTGARTATRPIVLYTDDDTVLHPLWVYHGWKTFDDEEVKAMTGLVLAQELKTEAQWIFEKYWPFNRGYIDKRYDSDFFNGTLASGPPVWDIGAGANMGFRKTVFEETGYFDERLDVGAAGCNGDSEMWYRILAAGGVIQYNPRAIVSHFHRESMDKLQSQIFSYMRGFTAAVLFQYAQHRHKGNLKHLFLQLPKYYCHLLVRGFPFYRNRFSTVFSEMQGLFSGLIFYIKNRNTPSNIR